MISRQFGRTLRLTALILFVILLVHQWNSLTVPFERKPAQTNPIEHVIASTQRNGPGHRTTGVPRKQPSRSRPVAPDIGNQKKTQRTRYYSSKASPGPMGDRTSSLKHTVPQTSPQDLYKYLGPQHKEGFQSFPWRKVRPKAPIQHQDFVKETDAEKEVRVKRLQIIKDACRHSWNSYRRLAWRHDEIRSESGQHNDHDGWAETLVGSLGTLQLMGLSEDLAVARQEVAKIDFTETNTPETSVTPVLSRYLGGLLSLNDLSKEPDKMLISKARDVANLILKAFDTPDHLPDLHHNFQTRQSDDSPNLRSSNLARTSELGSLSLELSRLSILTGDDIYFDAAQRVDAELFKLQSRLAVPGLFPALLDTDGCVQTEQRLRPRSEPVSTPFNQPNRRGANDTGIGKVQKVPVKRLLKRTIMASVAPDYMPPKVRLLQQQKPTYTFDGKPIEHRKKVVSVPNPPDDTSSDLLPRASDIKRDIPVEAHDTSSETVPQNSASQPSAKSTKDETEDYRISSTVSPRRDKSCRQKGLTAFEPLQSTSYNIGPDSAGLYAKMVKMNLLTGAAVQSYSEVWEASSAAIIDKILFRPMLPDNRDTLLAGELNSNLPPNERGASMVDASSCSAAGLFALSSRMYQKEQHLHIAERLAEGCYWTSRLTNTKLLPETFEMRTCRAGEQCLWDEARLSDQGSQPEHGDEDAGAQRLAMGDTANAADQYGSLGGDQTGSEGEQAPAGMKQQKGPMPNSAARKAAKIKAAVEEQKGSPIYMNSDPFEKPTAMISIRDTSYSLSPEIIESIFFMWRITGDKKWQEYGWNLFTQIQLHCSAPFGFSGIIDTTDKRSERSDLMPSYWLSATLKYFFLLFSDPNLVSLDEYVFNSDGHPLRIAKPKAKEEAS